MVSPINSPGLARSNPQAPPVNPQGRNPNAMGGSAGDPQAIKPETQTIRTPEDAINVLKARLFQRLEQQLGQGADSGNLKGAARFTPPPFEAPSAELVAQRVLGFVQQRLQAEARDGANAERLTGLLADARAGVAQGFTEAREQIDALGLMTDPLGLEIDDSFNRIQKGFAELFERLIKPQLPQEPQTPSEA